MEALMSDGDVIELTPKDLEITWHTLGAHSTCRIVHKPTGQCVIRECGPSMLLCRGEAIKELTEKVVAIQNAVRNGDELP
jgi:hypothetical protein